MIKLVQDRTKRDIFRNGIIHLTYVDNRASYRRIQQDCCNICYHETIKATT